MEPFQPFLIALLAVVVTTALALLIRTRRERRLRRQEQAIIEAATPRMQSRLSAIGDPSIPPEPEPPYVPYVPVAAPHPIPTVAEATVSRRRVWRDASAALVVVASIGLVIVLALPATGTTAPDQSVPPSLLAALSSQTPTDSATPLTIALVASPLPTRVDVVLPTEEPTPTLPVTGTPPPTAEASCGSSDAAADPEADTEADAEADPETDTSTATGRPLHVLVRGRYDHRADQHLEDVRCQGDLALGLR